jgi:hypothetical protein
VDRSEGDRPRKAVIASEHAEGSAPPSQPVDGPNPECSTKTYSFSREASLTRTLEKLTQTQVLLSVRTFAAQPKINDARPREHANQQSSGSMFESTKLSPCETSLKRRRVLYQTDRARFSEGVVTCHDLVRGTVIVMDANDGTFWRGSESLVEVIV